MKFISLFSLLVCFSVFSVESTKVGGPKRVNTAKIQIVDTSGSPWGQYHKTAYYLDFALQKHETGEGGQFCELIIPVNPDTFPWSPAGLDFYFNADHGRKLKQRPLVGVKDYFFEGDDANRMASNKSFDATLINDPKVKQKVSFQKASIVKSDSGLNNGARIWIDVSIREQGYFMNFFSYDESFQYSGWIKAEAAVDSSRKGCKVCLYYCADKNQKTDTSCKSWEKTQFDKINFEVNTSLTSRAGKRINMLFYGGGKFLERIEP